MSRKIIYILAIIFLIILSTSYASTLSNLQQGLVQYISFNNNCEAETGNDCTLGSDAPTYQTTNCFHEGCYNFSQEYINTTEFIQNADQTISMWINIRGTYDSDSYFAGSTSASERFYFGIDGGTDNFKVGLGSSSSDAATAFTPDTWQHLLIQYTASSKTADLYLDNALIKTYTNAGSTSPEVYFIGGHNNNGAPYGVNSRVNCTIDEYALWNRLLTEAERTWLSDSENVLSNTFWIQFSEVTSGYIEVEDCITYPELCVSFNTSNLNNISTPLADGQRVTIKFNPDDSGNWQQIYQFDINRDSSVREYLEVITPDLVQEIKVSSDYAPLEDALVTAYVLSTNPDLNASDWITVYSDFSSVDGVSTILLNDENTYKICADKDGYTSQCNIYYIPPSNDEIILIDIESEDTEEGSNYIATTCPDMYDINYNCTLSVNLYMNYTAVCVNYSDASQNLSSCTGYSAIKSYLYSLTNETGNVTLKVILDDNLTRTINHQWIQYNVSVAIDWDSETDSAGKTLLDRIKEDKMHLMVTYIILIIIGVIMGFMAEKYFKDEKNIEGAGVYGTMVWFTFCALSGIYLLWVPVIIIAVYAIITKMIPLFTNT